ncbi:DUF1636 domain-containing protein [Roseomonas gilardii]|uniref:DUF1636 domain-containing protein n=1 Tax=Roseomonas gilardii TaxID=257708 RepID=A0ABU3MFA1_9PROT|nr:DUF1636 domain-containing protein [Roseomonas gilardii]MDT8331030.1 DUF1636 domain-containing protein [Roseomonas gilardii]
MRVSIPGVPRLAEPVLLHVCITCRAGLDLREGDPPEGQRLHDAVADALAARPDSPVRLRAATCMASCEQGCAAALAAPGKWQYLLGRLLPEQAGDLLDYGALFAASRTGVVMPSKRPASLKQVVLGRVPPFAAPEPAEPTQTAPENAA